MDAVDATPADSTVRLKVRYNGRVQSAIDTTPETRERRQPPEGATFLVVQFEITNTGDEPLELTPDLFAAEVRGVRYDPVAAGVPFDDLRGVSIEPGGTFMGWVPFWIPKDAPNATLVVDQSESEKTVAVRFTRDFALNPDVPAGD